MKIFSLHTFWHCHCHWLAFASSATGQTQPDCLAFTLNSSQWYEKVGREAERNNAKCCDGRDKKNIYIYMSNSLIFADYESNGRRPFLGCFTGILCVCNRLNGFHFSLDFFSLLLFLFRYFSIYKKIDQRLMANQKISCVSA